jgi:hypothetical protein
LRSGAGDFDLDFERLTIERLSVQSPLGNVRLRLPSDQACALDVRLTLGDLALVVPLGVEVRLKFQGGWLARAQVSEPRLGWQRPGEWATAGAAAIRPANEQAPPVCVVNVYLGAGELTTARDGTA